MTLVMNCLHDRVKKALVGVRREVNHDLALWSQAAGHLDVQHHFSVSVASRLVVTTIHRNGAHLWVRKVELVEVRLQVSTLVAAPSSIKAMH